ncbi:Guanine nucleotide-binding protein alpha-2 subunit [Tulasnella sp. UAMH 9824]|nr:Guanine nucleotide-binding protein alpha-2 subunit [Tulasnella sp. UAMH 9824]
MPTGTPGSGKSTIIKQMKIIVQDGYTSEELAEFRLTVYENLVDSAKDLVSGTRKIGLEFVQDINRKDATQILEYEIEADSSFRLAPDIANAIDCIWKDPIIATVMDRSSEFYLPDSAPYFFSEVQRISQDDYVPSLRDVLKAEAKARPKGIVEMTLNVGELPIRILDVSGLQSERKKWIHCFEAVTSIIFCAALSHYDQVLWEDKEQTRMTESLTLFDSIVNSRWFSRMSVILFLTKIEVFKAKLAKAPFERYFPEYTGGQDAHTAARYILRKYTQANRASSLDVYAHITNEFDTLNFRLVLAAVKDTILRNALQDIEILRNTEFL